MTNHLPAERIEHRILVIRGLKVMLDSDLAELYGVPTRRLNEQVRRNITRFPADFMFQLTEEESKELNPISGVNGQRGGRRYRPYAFTEPGAGMLASVLRNTTAAKVTIEILRAFARLRQEEELESLPGNRSARSLFAAIRDVILLQPGDEIYTTSESYTYFVQVGDDGPIKIGATRNLRVRLRTLCAMFPMPLKLLGVMKGEDAEQRCHFRFGAFRLHGEWFAPSPVVLDFIRENSITPESCRSQSNTDQV